MELPILNDIVVILGFSVVTILLFQKLRLPAILGFLITGIMVGPSGLHLINDRHEVEPLSEIGIIFLLFVIGIEFSLKSLSSIRNTVVGGGILQVGGTLIAVMVIAVLLGYSWQSSIFIGCLLSLSSTAIVLKMLQQQGEITAPHGRVSVAILIFQDIIVVPMILITPLLAGKVNDPESSVPILLAKVVGVVIAVILLARYIVPLLLSWVAKTKSQELFIVTIVLICFFVAWLTSFAGLSLALGAFFAGLIVSESEYSHQATANILPFREIFISFFFVSIGMLLDVRFFVEHVPTILLATSGVIIMKFLIIMLTVLLLKYPTRVIFLTALSLFQVGEFAFLLSSVGMRYDLLSADTYQYFLSVSIISMALTPFAIAYSSSILNYFFHSQLPEPIRSRFKNLSKKKYEGKKTDKSYRDHMVIIGYGINGENVALAASSAELPHVIIELDPAMIKKAKKSGETNIVYGDATNETILKHVHIQEARVAVIAISSPRTTRNIVKMIRSFSETTYIIVRTRYVREVEEIIRLGADEVIPEEFETSIEIFTRVLKRYLITRDEILRFVHEIRSRNYEKLREMSEGITSIGRYPLSIPDIEIASLQVQQGNNKVVGKSILESMVRTNFNVTVVAIKRDNKFISQISPDDKICQNDILYIIGHPDRIIDFNKYLSMD
ncbi:MAG TPA: cation:proton antiporter [Cyclobacteriaceae bacterium]